MKEQETSGLLSSLGTKTPLIKIPLLVALLFWKHEQVNVIRKIN